jgi:gas vesicle protein
MPLHTEHVRNENHNHKEATMSRNNGYLKGLLFGGAIAAVISMLYAPKTGKEMRKDLRHGSRELYFETDKKVRELRRRAEKMLVEGRMQAQNLRARAQAKLTEAGTTAKKMFPFR